MFTLPPNKSVFHHDLFLPCLSAKQQSWDLWWRPLWELHFLFSAGFEQICWCVSYFETDTVKIPLRLQTGDVLRLLSSAPCSPPPPQLLRPLVCVVCVCCVCVCEWNAGAALFFWVLCAAAVQYEQQRNARHAGDPGRPLSWPKEPQLIWEVVALPASVGFKGPMR